MITADQATKKATIKEENTFCPDVLLCNFSVFILNTFIMKILSFSAEPVPYAKKLPTVNLHIYLPKNEGTIYSLIMILTKIFGDSFG